MPEYKNVNEGVIRDIVDFLGDAKKTADAVAKHVNRNKASNSWTSIARASSNLTLVFPVIASKNVSIENSSMIAKAIERKGVSMLQMLFAANQVSDASNLEDYIKYFHNNIDFDKVMPTVDDIISFSDDMSAAKERFSGTVKMESGVLTDSELLDLVKEDYKNRGYVLGDDISDTSVNEYRLRNTMYGTQIMLERKMDDRDYKIQDLHDKNKMLKDKLDKLTDERELAKQARESDKLSADKAKNKIDYLNKQVLDTDAKKANELVPSMLIVNFNYRDTETNNMTQINQGVIGVKAKLFLANPTDIINRVHVKNEDNQGLVKFIRATTKEISFWKDFIFAIDNAKIDAVSSAKRGSTNKFWKVLERRAVKSKRRRIAGKPNDAAAITTLVISQEEVELLKKEYQIDLEHTGTAHMIMDVYNLMCISIVDEANEVAKFIFDTNDDTYENMSFRNLEREASDGSYKKIVNLMSKVTR